VIDSVIVRNQNMHLTSVSTVSCFFVLFSSPDNVSATRHVRRQSNGVSINDFCFEFQLIGSTLSAICVTADAIPMPTSKDLNRCLTNSHEALEFDLRYS
jgi:hypothetical protein